MQKRFFIISGCSSGIGYAICKHFAKAGHRVLAGYRQESDRQRLQQIPNVIPIRLDVTKLSDIQNLQTEVSHLCQNDEQVCLINNAGIAKGGAVETTSIEEYRKVFEVNLFGTIQLTQSCLPWIRKTRGRIVNISSISGLFASPYMSPYSTSKFALEAFADSLRAEVSDFGVSVSNINPGFIDTPIWDKTQKDQQQMISDHPEYRNRIETFGRKLESKVKKTMMPVEAVVEAVDKAIFDKSPKANQVVGRLPVRILMKLIPILPKKIIVALVRQ